MVELTFQREKKSAQYFIEDLGNGIGLHMILVPGGTMILLPGGMFQMGSPDSELDRSSSEGPQHLGSYPE